MAQYEVAAHRYADISDSQYGVSLLNDCKYGYKVHDQVLDLNLLRSSKWPDYTADIGKHGFTYCLLPHKGSLIQSNVINNAAVVNQPPICFEGYKNKNMALPFELESDNISLEVIKKAEKGNCLVIRVVELKGQSSNAVLIINIPFEKIVRTNLIEWTDGVQEHSEGNTLDIELKPFELRTYKIYQDIDF